MATIQKPISFTGTVLAGHKGSAVEVPFNPSVQWGLAPVNLRKGRNGHRVQAAVNGFDFEGDIVPRSRRFWLQLPEELVERADAGEGAEVRIRIAPLA